MDILNYGIFATGEECFALISSIEHPYIHIPAKVIVRHISWPNRFRCYYHVDVIDLIDDDNAFLHTYLNATFRVITNDDWKLCHLKSVSNTANPKQEFLNGFAKTCRFDLSAPMMFKSMQDMMSCLDDYVNKIKAHFINIQTTISAQNVRYSKYTID